MAQVDLDRRTRRSLASPPVHRRRVVSLVPSLTESVAATAPELLVGVTDWCSHPAELPAARIGGTKNPRIADIVGLRPDVVLVNTEENREADIAELRAVGTDVWVTDFETVPDALNGLRAMLQMLGLGTPDWLANAADVWAAPWHGSRRTAVVPIWRRPWMALGRDTFAGDVLRRVGVDNALAGASERYPRFDLGDLAQHDLVVLPDEPYAFSDTDGPEAFAAPTTLVSGRYLTWYGPSLVEARQHLTDAIWK